MFHLETDRLILKPHTPGNAEKLNQWRNDPGLLNYNADQPLNHPPHTIAETRRDLRRMMAQKPVPTAIYYAIHKKTTYELIGYGAITRIDHYNRSCVLNIVIGEQGEQRQGYAREALEAVIRHCFIELRMNRLGAEIYAHNIPTTHLLGGLGFQREGAVRQAVWRDNDYSDVWIYGLLHREWLEASR